MGLAGACAIAFRELRLHPWRSLLAAQGLIWAVAITIVPSAILEGSRRNAEERAAELGVNRIEVYPDPDCRLDEMPQESDLAPLAEALGPKVAFAPLRVKSAGDVYLLGTTDRIAEARSLVLAAGRFPKWESSEGVIDVLIEAELAAKLFPGGDAFGKTLQLERGEGGKGYRVSISPTGTLRIGGVTLGGAARRVDLLGIKDDEFLSSTIRGFLKSFGNISDRPPWLENGMGIYLPYALLAGEGFQWLFLAADPHDVGRASTAAREVLALRGRRMLVSSNAIWQLLVNPELEGYLALHRVFAATFFAMGFVMMANLLLLAGWRRRAEIALRRVEGASRLDIFAQFVAEGALLALGGLAAGVPLGLGIAAVRVWLDPNVVLAVALPWREVLGVALLLAAGTVLISALPAWRASRHAPLLLLRGTGAP